MGRGARWTTVHGVTKSRTRLSTLHIYTLTPSLFIWIFYVLKVTDVLPAFKVIYELKKFAFACPLGL